MIKKDTGAHGRAPAGNENRMFSCRSERVSFAYFSLAQQRKVGLILKNYF